MYGYGIVCFTCISINSLVGRRVSSIQYRKIQIKNSNTNLELVHFVDLCCMKIM
jgi:hypothetical protein